MGLRTITRRARRGVALLGLGVVGGAAIVTARHALMTPQPLRSGLPGAGDIDRRHGGSVYYALSGPVDAPPLVLLHEFYPGASNYEFRAIYPRLAETYRVYAPDWLGFGMSERPALRLNGEFYAAMLLGFLRDVAGRPAVVVARGRAANIAARAAADAPELFDRLILVGPDLDAGERLDPTPSQVAARLFQRVSLGLTPYAALSLRPALRLAEGMRSAIGPGQVDSETLDQLYASAHQFGAQHGALALLTGELDLPVQQVFPTLVPPALVVAGERDRKLPAARLERLVGLNPHADLEITLAAGAAVYQDQPKLFLSALHRWLGRKIPRQQARVEARAVGEATALAAIIATGRPATAVAAVTPTILDGDLAAPALDDTAATPLTTETPIATEAPGAPPAPGAHGKLGVAPVKVVPVLDAHSRPFDPRDLRDLRDLPDAGAEDAQRHVSPTWGRRTAPRPSTRSGEQDSPTRWWRGADDRDNHPSDARNHRRKGPNGA